MSELHHCDFCGKTNNEVKKLIAGPRTMICNECIALCVSIIISDDPTAKIDASRREGIDRTIEEADRFLQNLGLIGRLRLAATLHKILPSHLRKSLGERG